MTMADQFCTSCLRDDVESPSTTLCTDCEEWLCADCTKAHRRNKLSLSHVLLDVSQISSLPQSTISSQTFCDIHCDIALEFYCPGHDQTCCRSCMVETHRTCDKVVPLSEAAKNIKSDPIVEEIAREIENIIKTSDALLQMEDQNLQDLDLQQNKILEEISNVKSRAIEEFDILENALKQDLSKERNKVDESVSNQKKTMEEIRNAITVSNAELEFVERYASDVHGYIQLRKVKDDLKKQADNLVSNISKIKRITIAHDNKINVQVKSLGSTEVEISPCPIVYNSLLKTSSKGDKVDVPNKAPLEIPTTCIRRGMKIKSSIYTEIWKGTWASVETKQSKIVAIKTVKDQDSSFKHVMNQINILAKCDHSNIITLYGICSVPPLSMVLEYMTRGSLSQFLSNLEDQATLMTEQLEELASIAVQICSGMNYLFSKRIVHTDLSAKNILIGEDNVAKITGFGMAKILENGDTLKMDSSFSVALKWTAPEVVFDKTLSIMSDVWSFGIVIVEIVTFGREPYPGTKKQDIMPLIKSGYRHPQPEGCPDVVYDVLLRCWNIDPMQRPTFEFLYNFFDTVEVINLEEKEDDTLSVTSGDYQEESNEEPSTDSRPRNRSKESFSKADEDILPKQLSKSKKRSSKEKDKCLLS